MYRFRTLILILVTILAPLPSLALAAASTEVTWFGHSAYRIKTPAGKILFIDPWIKNPANKNGEADVAAIDRADLILLTHGHGDHIGNSTEIGKKTGAKLVANFDLSKAMVRYAGFPAAQAGIATSGSFGGEIALLDGEVKVAFIPAIHGSGLEVPAADTKMPADLMYAGNPGGFVVKIKDGPTIYHTGDTDLFSDMALVKGFGPIDLMMVCIGDRFTMGPKRAAEAVKLVAPKTAIPMHYGTFPLLTGTPETFEKEMKTLKLDVKKGLKVMKAGETLTWKK